MHTRLETITPDRARKLLGHNLANRRIRQAVVTMLAGSILRGEWTITHQGIALRSDGTLLDGQHRLLAIIKANLAVQMLVSYDVPSAAFDVVDTCFRRSATDALDLRGETNTRLRVSIVRLRMTVEQTGVRGSARPYTTPEVITYLDAHPSVTTCAPMATLLGAHTRVHKSSLGAALSMITDTTLAYDTFREFVDGVHTGANLGARDPRLTFRNYAAKATRRPAAAVGVALTIKAWNAYRQDRPMSQLRWNDDEPFPAVIA